MHSQQNEINLRAAAAAAVDDDDDYDDNSEVTFFRQRKLSSYSASSDFVFILSFKRIPNVCGTEPGLLQIVDRLPVVV